MVRNLIILASGNGTNAQRIIEYFNENRIANVPLVITNNPKAGVLERCKKLGVSTRIASREAFYNGTIVTEIREYNPVFIILAGFLWLLPTDMVQAFPNKIVNIHPALLPAYGGKGMYGHHVHEAVIRNGETESGITIHYVNEFYDEGQIIFQARTIIDEGETPDSLAGKIHQLEYRHFPEVIADLLP